MTPGTILRAWVAASRIGSQYAGRGTRNGLKWPIEGMTWAAKRTRKPPSRPARAAVSRADATHLPYAMLRYTTGAAVSRAPVSREACEAASLERTLVADRIAQLLQREGAEFVVGFPENRLLDSASALGMRPIITRTERVAVNIADGFARATNGERITACVTQYGPGAEAAFGAVAQAYGDRSPILLIPGEHDRDNQDSAPNLRTEQAYRPVTRFAATVNDAGRAPDVFRRALHALRVVRDGPVLVAVANDVLNGAAGDAGWDVASSPPRLSQAAPADVAETLAGPDPGVGPGHPGRPGGAVRRRVRGARAARRAHRHPGCHHPERQERLPREPSARARHRRPHPAGHRRPVPRACRRHPRHRHELHPLALHHAAARGGRARPDRERRPRHRLRLRRGVRLRRRRPARPAPDAGRARPPRRRAARAADGAGGRQGAVGSSWTGGCRG